MGQLLLERPALRKEISREFGFVNLYDVASGLDLRKRVLVLRFFVGTDKFVFELEKMVVISLLRRFLRRIWVFLPVH